MEINDFVIYALSHKLLSMSTDISHHLLLDTFYKVSNQPFFTDSLLWHAWIGNSFFECLSLIYNILADIGFYMKLFSFWVLWNTSISQHARIRDWLTYRAWWFTEIQFHSPPRIPLHVQLFKQTLLMIVGFFLPGLLCKFSIKFMM